jgi:hypothetical protein
MMGGRILALAVLACCAGCALAANCWRSMQQGEGMYDAESMATMRLTGWLGLVLGLLLALGAAFVLAGTLLRWFS